MPFARMLRQPLEHGKLTISRAAPGTGPIRPLFARAPALTYSARRLMITAMKASRRREWERLANRMRVVLASTPVHGCR